jgi:hypothetical protein
LKIVVKWRVGPHFMEHIRHTEIERTNKKLYKSNNILSKKCQWLLDTNEKKKLPN